MKIELSNGQLKFWQWDAGQKVQVPENVPTVHLKFGKSAVELPVLDRWVDVPDELLQTGNDILLWTYDEDHTLDAVRIPVEKRLKPADYVYTPTEIKTWEQLDKRIAALEAANVQPNWDQNDTSAADYIRGRTHYVGAKHDVKIINQKSGEFTPELGLIVGNTYRVWYDGGHGFGDAAAAKEFVCQTHSTGDGTAPNPFDGKPYVGNAGTDGGPNPYLIFDNFIFLHGAFDHVVSPRSWKIEGDFADIKTLDSKYLDPELLKRIQALEDGGGVAGVSSINGQTGAVTITAEGLGALTEDNLQIATNAALDQAKASGEFDGARGPKGDPGATGPQGPAGAGLDVTGATVGQTVKISAVDESGVPTAWEPVDMASGEKWEKIAEIVIPDGAAETNALTINKDINGDQFRLVKARLCIKQPKYTGESNIPSFSFAMINGKTTGRITQLAYTSAFRMPSKTIISGSVYEVDVSGAQQIETVYRSGTSVGWSPDDNAGYITYSRQRDEYVRYVADTLWAKPITSIGGTGMLIYPGCRYVLYGVRE